MVEGTGIRHYTFRFAIMVKYTIYVCVSVPKGILFANRTSIPWSVVAVKLDVGSVTVVGRR